MWWDWEMSNAQSCDLKSNREFATLWFVRQSFHCRSWNTQTSVCWIRFILYLVQCLDVVSSTQLCHILHGLRLQYCYNLLIDYKTSYSFQHAGSSYTVITIDTGLQTFCGPHSSSHIGCSDLCLHHNWSLDRVIDTFRQIDWFYIKFNSTVYWLSLARFLFQSSKFGHHIFVWKL